MPAGYIINFNQYIKRINMRTAQFELPKMKGGSISGLALQN